MVLRGGPFEGMKFDGRRTRGSFVTVKVTGKHELAEYRRGIEKGVFEFTTMVTYTPARRRRFHSA
jgi:hypothetical protein